MPSQKINQMLQKNKGIFRYSISQKNVLPTRLRKLLTLAEELSKR